MRRDQPALRIGLGLTRTRLAWGMAVRVVVALLVAAGCAKGGSARAPDVLPRGIVVVKDARNVVSRRPEDSPNKLSVSYTVRAPYPATAVLADIRARLETSGWKPLPMDWIDPTKPSSHKIGWRSHVNEYPLPKKQYFNWSAQWSNPEGDVVVYFLRYEGSPPGSDREGSRPDNDDLRVQALLMPRRLVPVKALPASLILLDGARDVSTWRDQSLWRFLEYEMGVKYTVTATYPPSEVMSNLTERLEKQGWAPFEDRPPWLPAHPSTLSRTPGWKAETRRLATEQLFQWVAHWRNRMSEQVAYVLSYNSSLPLPGVEASKPDNNDLHIEATFLSKAAETGSAAKQPGRVD